MAVLQKDNQTSEACSPHILSLGLLGSRLSGPLLCLHFLNLFNKIHVGTGRKVGTALL